MIIATFAIKIKLEIRLIKKHQSLIILIADLKIIRLLFP